MPNHITNLLTVTGPESDVAAFREAHIKNEERGPRFDFDTIIPTPPCVAATSRPCGPGDAIIGDAAVKHYARALLTNHYERILPGDGVYHMPPEVVTWRDLIAHYDRTNPAVAKWARASLTCAAETGYPGWYEWNCANWGTKWGAYDYAERSHESGRFIFEFQTAWSSPQPIFRRLAEMWPSLTIEVEAIDEGGGEYVGRYHGTEQTFALAEDDDARYLRVYGEERPKGDEEDEDE